MTDKILVTPRSITSAGGHAALKPLTDAGYRLVFTPPCELPNEATLTEMLPGCAGYLAGVETVSASVLSSADALRVISRNGVGTDRIDVAALQERGIALCTAAGANARGVAELAIGLLFSLVRGIPTADRGIKAGQWPRQVGTETEGKTLGIIGFGRIGRLVAQLASGIGLNVLICDPMLRDKADASPYRVLDLESLVASSDFITLHCPPPKNGQPLLGRALLKKARDGVYLINTARHELFEPVALKDSLDSGRVAGVALDVFASEPPELDALLLHERVVTTSHLGGLTTQSVERAVRAAVDGLLQHLPARVGSEASHG